MTSEQVRNRTKTVTRRQGWLNAKPGQIVQPIEKGQGLKKGEHQRLIGGPIRFISVKREPIEDIGFLDVAREGFPWMSADGFVGMYCKANRCKPSDNCTRIEFEYLNGQNSTAESVPADGKGE